MIARFLHLSIDGFKGEKMDEVKDGSTETATYALSRMVPPGKLYGFFTVEEEAPTASTSDDPDDDGDDNAETKQGGSTSRKKSYTFFTAEQVKTRAWTRWSHKAAIVSVGLSENFAPGGGIPPEVNVWAISKQAEPVVTKMCAPRIINGKDGQVFRPKTWSLANSIFSKRAQESDCNSFFNKGPFLQRILRTDWRFTKLARWLPQKYKRSSLKNYSQLYQSIQAALAPHVGVMLQLFKFICAVSATGTEDGFTFMKKPLLTALQAFEFGKKNEVKCRGVHTVNARPVSKSDIDTLFTVVNLELESGGDSNEAQAVAAMNDDNPDNALTRFEWLELIVRLAAKRFQTVAHEAVSFHIASSSDANAVVGLCSYHPVRSCT